MIVDCHTHIDPGHLEISRTGQRILKQRLQSRFPNQTLYTILLPVQLREPFNEYSTTNEQVDKFANSLDDDCVQAITAMTADWRSLGEDQLRVMIEAKQEQFPEYRPVFKLVPAAAEYTIKDIASGDYSRLLQAMEKTGTVLFMHLDYIGFMEATGNKEERYNSPMHVRTILKQHPNLQMHLAHFGGEQYMLTINDHIGEEHHRYWVDEIADILSQHQNVSAGMEGLVRPPEQEMPTDRFFAYMKSSGYFDKFKKSGQLMIGSDHPANGFESGLDNMIPQCKGNWGIYTTLVQNTTKRFRAK